MYLFSHLGDWHEEQEIDFMSSSAAADIIANISYHPCIYTIIMHV